MKKLWGLLCVVGFTGFWVYALAIAAALFGDRLFHPVEMLLSLAGLALGLVARWKLRPLTPAMQWRRAEAPSGPDDTARQQG